jgi:glyoxylase I family protein
VSSPAGRICETGSDEGLDERGLIRGLHHFGLTVRDADASAAWYADVLGFQRVGEFDSPDGAWRKVFLRHTGLQARVGLTEHRDGSQDVFDETRVGLDHLAFAVSNRTELDEWARRLEAAAVTHSAIAPANSIPGAAVLVFRDPDNIQLELFVDPSDIDPEANKQL